MRTTIPVIGRPRDEPIITSRLDTDFYKETMGQLIWRDFREVPVTFGLINRSPIRLADCIDHGQFREELDAARQIDYTTSDLHYLRGTNEYQERMFAEDYLRFKAQHRLPSYDLLIHDGQFDLRFSGSWSEVTDWETVALSIIQELYTEYLMRDLSRYEREAVMAEAVRRLYEKVRIIKQYADIIIVEFGTRRRAFRAWQEYVTTYLQEALGGQLRGTSNTFLAHKLSLLPMGTNAHEMEMVLAALAGEDDDALRLAPQQFLDLWWGMYDAGLSVALPDTFGSKHFFDDFGEDRARKWKGFRHDSGSPIEFGERVIRYYQNFGIDPRQKMIIFSDGLDLKTILELRERFHQRITISFGWGTNLTNDLGFKAISIVIKILRAAGRSGVKLSDNLAKAMGDPTEVARYKRVFGHTVQDYVECKV